MSDDLERRIRGLRNNYDVRAQHWPEPRAQWSDIVRDLDEALGELDRTKTLPRHLLPHAEFGDGPSGDCYCAGCDPREDCTCPSCRTGWWKKDL